MKEKNNFNKSKLQLRFSALLDFFRLPFQNVEDRFYNEKNEALSAALLKVKIQLNEDNNEKTHSPNHCVADGRVRIELQLWHELLHEKNQGEILLSTHCLDEDLYSKSSIDQIESLAKTKPIKILYKKHSVNIERMKNVENIFLKEIKNDSIKNFIVGQSTASLESTQSYDDNGKLATHEADFYYNVSKDFEIVKENVSIKISELIAKFNTIWNNS
jgi:hypothetical protein